MSSFADPSITVYLVRYGRLQRVAWFGTIEDLRLVRGQQVVVVNAEGMWCGEVLQVAPVSSPQRPQPTGEVLRPLAATDQQRRDQADQVCVDLYQQANAAANALRLESSAASALPATKITVLDTDVSLDLTTGVIQFLGPANAMLGREAARLAELCGLQRSQWLPAQTALQESSPTSQSPLSLSTELTQSTGADPQHEIQHALAILRADATELTGANAKRARGMLGLIGTYLQKIIPVAKGTRSNNRQNNIRQNNNRHWMLRLRTTGGSLTVHQLLGLMQLANDWGDGRLRLTMRQSLQFHGVVHGSLQPMLQQIQSLLMSTQGTCGDTVRNITCCPLTPTTPLQAAARKLAIQLNERWLPQAGWFELAIEDAGGQPSSFSSLQLTRDPVYPNGYLPHKCKFGVATSDDNCINVLVNDVAIVVRHDGTQFMADCYLGGSLSYRPGDQHSAAQLARPLISVPISEVHAVIEVVVRLWQQQPPAKQRHFRRLKYLVQQVGMDSIRAHLFAQLPAIVGNWQRCDPQALRPWTVHPTWLRRVDGAWTCTASIRGGRLQLNQSMFPQAMELWRQLLTACSQVRIGPAHTIVFDAIPDRSRCSVERLLADPALVESGVLASDAVGQPSLRLLTCVAKPTCPFALAETETQYDRWEHAIRPLLPELHRSLGGVETNQPVIVALSGCPHGCSQSQAAHVGITAESADLFRITVGGNGQQLGIFTESIGKAEELGQIRLADNPKG